MQFDYMEPQTEYEKLFGGHFHVNAYGTIKSGDGEKFKRFIEVANVLPRTHIYINSSGGDVIEAIEIGRAIRAGWFSTEIGLYTLGDPDPLSPYFVPRVRHPGICMSAATLVFLGGRLRYYSKGAQFGVHRFSYLNPSPENFAKSQVLSAKISRYIVDMNINLEFLEISSSIDSEKIEILTEDYLEKIGVVTGSETKPEWTTQAKNGLIYVRGERDSLFGHHKVILGYNREFGFCFWAVIEAQGRENELTTFGSVEIVINGEDIKIDISKRCTRTINGIYVNVISQITIEEAEIIAHSQSFGVYIRAGNEAPMFLGIAPMKTKEGEGMLKTLFDTGAK